MNRNLTGKLQVTLLSAYIFQKKFVLSNFQSPFGKKMYSEKMKEKHMKEAV